MNVIESLKYACLFLSLEDSLIELKTLEDDISAGTTTHCLNSDSIDLDDLNIAQKNLFFMYTNLGLILEEIATGYLPLKMSEELTSTANCEILYSSFSKPVRGVVSVNNDGYDCTYNEYPTFIKVGKPNEMYVVSYLYYPSFPASFSAVLECDNSVTARVLAYKLASDFCLKNNLYDESVMWEKRFVESINILRNSVSEKKFRGFPL